LATEPGQHRVSLRSFDIEVDRELDILRAIVEKVVEGLVVVDTRGRFLFFNPAATRIMGLGALDIDPQEWSKEYGLYQLDGSMLEPEQVPLARALRGETISECKLVVRNVHRAEGSVISVNAAPLACRRGETIGAVATFWDASSAYRSISLDDTPFGVLDYRELVERLNEGLWVSDDSGTTIFVNEQMANMLGYEVGEIVGRPVFDFLDEEGRAICNQKLARLRLGVKEDYELEMIAKDGSRICTITQASPLFGHEGRFGGSLVGVLDISKRKATEQALENAHDKLERTVAKRTAALRQALDEVRHLKEQLESENVALRDQAFLRSEPSPKIVGTSAGITEVRRQISQVATANATVLLLGETGTGKGLFAAELHRQSRLADKPFVIVDCATLPPTLIESELFGHEKGAFTGAFAAKAGRFELAHGGTLLLDEIGEIPLDLQGKLLRFLESGEFTRLGSTRTRHVEVRVIAATNRDVGALVGQGEFRSDLFYRLNVFPIRVPPLRDRMDDLTELVHYFVRQKRHVASHRIEGVSPSVYDLLQRYHWPGNIRELENILERGLILASGRTIETKDVSGALPLSVESGPSPLGDTPRTIQENERAFLLEALETCQWKIKGVGNAAERVGLAPSTLRNRMSRLGIVRPAKARPDKNKATGQRSLGPRRS